MSVLFNYKEFRLDNKQFDFLEHNNNNVIFANSSLIIESRDNGYNFNKTLLDIPELSIIDKCFTTNNGNHILCCRIKDKNTKNKIYIYSNEWELITSHDINYQWHGTWSIDENNGVIIYSEYTCDEDLLNINRSCDNGLTWSKVFSIQGKNPSNYTFPNDTPPNIIRHFHTCQFDKYTTDTWYASSGDYQNQNKIFRSKNNGITWEDITPIIKIVNSNILKVNAISCIFRHTSEIYSEKYIYWATDDRLHERKSRLVKLDKQKLELTILGALGAECNRNLIKINDTLAISISENKFLDKYALIYLVNFKEETCKLIDKIECCKKTGFTMSISSKNCIDNKFYSCVKNSEFNNLIYNITMEDKGCNVCNNIIRDKYNNNEDINYIEYKDKWQNHWVYLCPNCDSRSRIRIFQKYIETHYETNTNLKAYIISGIDKEYNILNNYFDIQYHTSFYKENRKNCIAGVDITKPIPIDKKFDFVWACRVLDYIPQIEKVFKEIYKVLNDKGMFIFYIMPGRISNNVAANNPKEKVANVDTIKITSNNALNHEKYMPRVNGITNCPSVIFNIEYIRKCAIECGFKFELVEIKDCISPAVEKLFVLTKL